MRLSRKGKDETIVVYSSFISFPEFDLSHIVFHWNLDRVANGYGTEIDYKYEHESMDLCKISTDVDPTFHI
jgi:hypothetical protein